MAQDGGEVAGIDVVIGRTRWRSTQGRWPLASAQQWVAVAGPDTADRHLLHVRFLRPADGALLVDAKPIRLPAPIGLGAGWRGEGLWVGAGNTTVQLFAWVPPPQRGPSRDPRAGRLRIRWRTQTFSGGGGMSPPKRGPAAVGLAFVDPVTGAVEIGGDDPAETPEPAPPAVPASWRPARGTMYWNWTPWGSAWSDKPRVFWIRRRRWRRLLQLQSPARRLVLNRLRALEAPPPAEIAAGGEWAPQVSMDGRFVSLSKGNAGVETFTLVDLLRGGAAAGATLAAPPRAALSLTVFRRRAVALLRRGRRRRERGRRRDYVSALAGLRRLAEKGTIRWTRALPARHLPPPMAGAGHSPAATVSSRHRQLMAEAGKRSGGQLFMSRLHRAAARRSRSWSDSRCGNSAPVIRARQRCAMPPPSCSWNRTKTRQTSPSSAHARAWTLPANVPPATAAQVSRPSQTHDPPDQPAVRPARESVGGRINDVRVAGLHVGGRRIRGRCIDGARRRSCPAPNRRSAHPAHRRARRPRCPPPYRPDFAFEHPTTARRMTSQVFTSASRPTEPRSSHESASRRRDTQVIVFVEPISGQEANGCRGAATRDGGDVLCVGGRGKSGRADGPPRSRRNIASASTRASLPRSGAWARPTSTHLCPSRASRWASAGDPSGAQLSLMPKVAYGLGRCVFIAGIGASLALGNQLAAEGQSARNPDRRHSVAEPASARD